jgi:hypothetical protein
MNTLTAVERKAGGWILFVVDGVGDAYWLGTFFDLEEVEEYVALDPDLSQVVFPEVDMVEGDE